MSNPTPANILKINSSGRINGSYSRKLVDQLVTKLKSKSPAAHVIDRDVSTGVEFVDEAWIEANFTPIDSRNEKQNQRLAESNNLVDELMAADTLIIGVPIYNFGIPATLKAWVDLITRANRTFKYTETGPKGLLDNKTAYLIITSGGTESGSEIDFATGYMRHILGFIGITDVKIIPADQLMMDEKASLNSAHELIAAA